MDRVMPYYATLPMPLLPLYVKAVPDFVIHLA